MVERHEMSKELVKSSDTDQEAVLNGIKSRIGVMIGRLRASSILGKAFGGKRDYYEVFGWDRHIDYQQMWQMYHRGGISKRIIHAYPDAVWAKAPQLYVEGNPEWNSQWDDLESDLSIWSAFQKFDVMSRLGRYAIMVIGTDRPNLQQPLNNPTKIIYMQPYAERNVRVSSWETNPQSARFGKPVMYTVTPTQNDKSESVQGTQTVAPVGASFRVHHSHVIHVAHNALENSIYGVPTYSSIWNYLIDLTKVVGSSAESYWLTAYQGMHADVDKELDLTPDDQNDLTDEIDDYVHGFRRFIRTRGVTVKSLGSKVADPRGAFDVLLTLISGTVGVPKRILLGSEAGQLASSQDKGNWAERIEEERELHSEPALIKPLIRFIATHKILGEVAASDVNILWPDAYRMSPLERGQTAAQTARTLANIIKALKEAQELEGYENILTPAEARTLVGLSTDQSLLAEQPN